ncbi:uridine kinase family protein [Oceanobacillus sp. CF4.6]|uniref:uridine kinase family protein n=1 Tax=Oceanobacillus sp. CF4.6 TaxID=3373080 RepID=UPI003EE4E220
MENNDKFQPIIKTLEKQLEENDHLIVAIEGRCGSGKSTLSKILGGAFDCNVFHMDDFFLPFEMKTKERLAEPGGNVHYERFKEEVLNPLKNSETISYRPYNCAIRALDKPIHTSPKKITLIEGVYCLHPSLANAYDYKIFMTVESQTQLKRIAKRNGEEKLQMFINQWIPLEEHYFSSLDVEKQCDYILNTTDFWD